MLIYHPAYDAYHCVFRMLLLADSLKELEVDKARILDFFLLFPGMIKTMLLPEALTSLRSYAKQAANTYRDPVNGILTFRDMRHIQEAAIKSLAASGLIDVKKYQAGFIVRTEMAIEPPLKQKLTEYMAVNDQTVGAIVKGLATIPLLGHEGLKHRSHLMEYRYDYA